MSAPQFDATATVPLSAPLYGASPSAAIGRVFAKYATFGGRASRSEFWWWYLVVVVVCAVLYTLALVTGGAGQVSADRTAVSPNPGFYIFMAALGAFVLGAGIPTVALFVRRLHDSNLSGLFALLVFVPFFGNLIVIILASRLSEREGARFDR